MSDNNSRTTPQVYTLTALTRAAGQSRRIVIAGFDLPLRGLIVTIAAIIVALIPTMVLWLFIGQMALVLPVLVIGAAFYLVESRSRSGLHLRTYQVMVDKSRSNIGAFLCCGKHVEPGMAGVGRIVQSSMRSPYLPDTDRELRGLLAPELADEPAERIAPPPATAASQDPQTEHRPPRSKRAALPRLRRRGEDPFAQAMHDPTTTSSAHGRRGEK